MRRILELTKKDLLQNLRDRKTFLFLLIMPVAFTLLFGLVFGGSSSKDTRPLLGYQDQGLLSPQLKALLASQGYRLQDEPDQTAESLSKLVGTGKLAAAVIVPAGYSQQALAGSSLKLSVIVDSSSSAGVAAQNDVQAAASRLLSAVRIAQVASQANPDPAALPALVDRALQAWQNPPIRLDTAQAGGAAQNKPSASPMQPSQTSPGMMAQFSIAALLTAAQVLVEERKSRTMQRLLTTSVSRAQILLGHYLAIFILIFVQLLILIAFGELVLKLGYFRVPAATLLLAVATAAFAAGLGLLIGALAKTDEQAIIFSLVLMFLLAGLGGAWVPLEVTSRAFQAAGHLTPLAWVMDGFQNIIVRGLDFNSVLLPLAVLGGYALLFFVLAVWKFKFE